jgi:hypothetical protein
MKSKNWVTTAIACQILELTPRQLRRKLPELKIGFHYREIGKPEATRTTYQWHIANLKHKLKI